ncbi:MAG TPA: 7-carboxy-7-deazaguanine synthase QueE [Legionellales bacterium]|nr:7-carboxy-7-deazaguanine synthase QueE [Legionellales bacterium]
MNVLRITEIFYSLQGESSTTGWPTIFIRLTGCPLRCQYCDTAYAFQGGQKKSFEAILQEIQQYRCKRICVTGGEPLAQPACYPFLTFLADHGYQVSIETSGARTIENIDSRIMLVMDLKTPDSKEEPKNLYTNIPLLKAGDQVKFVICSRADFDWSKQVLENYSFPQGVDILFSPSWHQVKPDELAQWILDDALNVRFQIQLHKILWEDGPGR